MPALNPNAVLTTPAASLDECRALLQRILASRAFSKSGRLSSFLSYICDLTLRGRADEINEQRIGEAVFGRPAGYDSSIDGIVRVQASRLRQRLDLYFGTEGAEEPLLMTVPRGGYVPVCEPRPAPDIPLQPQLVQSEAAASASEPSPGVLGAMLRVHGTLQMLGVISAVLILGGGAWLVFLRTHAGPSAQALAQVQHPLWGQFFRANESTLLVPGDSSLVIWEGLRNRNIDLADYLSGTYRTVLPGEAHMAENVAAELATRRYTSIVDLEIAQTLGRIAEARGGAVEIRYARDLRPNDLKIGNEVLIGDTEANPWVSLFEQKMNFVFSFNRAQNVLSVLNRAPRGDEPHQWNFVSSDREHRVYAVVAYLSNLSGDGHVLILEGTSMAGTECAWDFVSDDTQLMPFLNRIRLRNGSIPHFELVLGSNSMSGSSVRANILAWRVDG
jgi:hypothetical protein